MLTKESPLARADVYRRLIKPQKFTILNDICAILVEERERLEHELFATTIASPADSVKGLVAAVNRLLVIEKRIAKFLDELNTTEVDD